jgi:hypothetical protein
MTTWIQPYEQVITYTITHISISVTTLELNVKAGITTDFYDSQHILRRQEYAVIDGEDYQNWTSDDYVAQWVCKKYGLTQLLNSLII